jgi:hypothetical protein
MSLSAIAEALGVSKTWLYSLVKNQPAGVPRTREDLAQWRNFVNRHRIEPIGSDRIRLSR